MFSLNESYDIPSMDKEWFYKLICIILCSYLIFLIYFIHNIGYILNNFKNNNFCKNEYYDNFCVSIV